MAKKQNVKEVTKLFERKILQAYVDALNEAGALVRDTAKIYAPVDNGPLHDSIFFRIDENTMRGEVYTELEYAPHVEYGTVAHVIEPKEKKALAFEVDRKQRLTKVAQGKSAKPNMVIVKKVNHPGTRAQPFMRPALDANKQNIKKIFAYHLNKIK